MRRFVSATRLANSSVPNIFPRPGIKSPRFLKHVHNAASLRTIRHVFVHIRQ
jgi:hypothetical protein